MADEKTVDQLTTEELFQAAMAPAQAPEPVAEPEPTVVEEPVAPTPEPAPPPVAEDIVPSWRLREESERARQAEERARQMEERLQQISAHFQQSQQKQPDFFENPNQATQSLVLQMLQPYAEEQRKAMMHMGKMVASAVHGQDKVDQAEAAFLKARDEGSLDPADYERVVGSPNRFDAAVQWHKRQAVLSSVGDDPAAWFEKQLEARMADPKFQAALLERVRGSAAGKPSVVKLPPSLSKATAAAPSGGEPVGDMSDASLFAYAMKR